MSKKKNPVKPMPRLALYKYTPGIILSLGAAVVVAAAVLDKPAPEKEGTTVLYPSPVEETKVAEAPKTEIIVEVKPEVKPEPIPEPEIKVEPTPVPAPEIKVEESVPPIIEASKDNIQTPVIETPPVVVKENSEIVVEEIKVPLPVKKVVKKTCKKIEDKTTNDITMDNFLKGNGF